MNLDPDTLAVFREMNERSAAWDERLGAIQRTFPASTWGEKDWFRAFTNDPDLAGRILRDMLKSEQAVPGRPGPRPALDVARAQPTLDRWMGRDPVDHPYSMLPFAQSFALLAGNRSLRHLATKVSIPRMQVSRLLKGDLAPTGDMMEAVAKAFGKSPSWFLEYRIGTVAAAIMRQLLGHPEQSVRVYESLWHQAKRA